MKKILAFLVFGLMTTSAQAILFTPDFSDYSFPGSQYDVDAAANTYFEANYGITIDNMYLYTDSRDSFDGIGVANGFVSDIPDPVTGRINFVDGGTDFLTLDYLVIGGFDATYSVYSDTDVLLDSFFISALSDVNDTSTLLGGGSLISYLTISSNAGFSTVSGLTYDYDGVSDGHNDDIVNVPSPAPLALLSLGLLGLISRKKT